MKEILYVKVNGCVGDVLLSLSRDSERCHHSKKISNKKTNDNSNKKTNDNSKKSLKDKIKKKQKDSV